MEWYYIVIIILSAIIYALIFIAVRMKSGRDSYEEINYDNFIKSLDLQRELFDMENQRNKAQNELMKMEVHEDKKNNQEALDRFCAFYSVETIELKDFPPTKK
jgi:hypothetical protein